MSEVMVTPADCLLLFGIPTTKQAFFADLNRDDKDFAKLFEGRWARYEYQFVSELNRLRKTFLKAGVQLLENGSLEDFRIGIKRHRVVILFSHWLEDSVEFSDGLQHISAIAEAIPNDFSGVIDLCVCHPNQLAELVRATKPNCTVKYTTAPATPLMWLNFYSILFQQLHKSPGDYSSTLVELTRAYANNQLL